MKKDYTRDYITAAFRRYAAAGKPSADFEAQRLCQEYFEKNIKTKSTIKAQLNANFSVTQVQPYILDLIAVEWTLDYLERNNRGYVVKAIEAVYFVHPTRPLRRGDITNRVHRFSITYPASERQVYLWLQGGREVCARLRGLCLD